MLIPARMSEAEEQRWVNVMLDKLAAQESKRALGDAELAERPQPGPTAGMDARERVRPAPGPDARELVRPAPGPDTPEGVSLTARPEAREGVSPGSPPSTPG